MTACARRAVSRTGSNSNTGGRLKVQIVNANGLPEQFAQDTKDNQILSVAQYLKNHDKKVVFISKDINLRIKAEAIGLETEDFEKEKVDLNEFYRGWREISLNKEEIDAFYKDKKLSAKYYLANEYAILKSLDGGKASALARYDAEAEALVPLFRKDAAPWHVKPLNTEQRSPLAALASDLL